MHNSQSHIKGSFVQNVPPERFGGSICSGLLKGEAVLYASPRNAFAFLTPCSVFLYKGDFAVCGQRQGGFTPLTPTTFEKVDETFSVCYFVKAFSF